jgi:hypothetical protein
VDSRPLGFIFHTAFCGSTLLARALHLPPYSFVLKEPSALLGLASRAAEVPVGIDARVLRIGSELARPRENSARIVRNQVNTIAARLLAAFPDTRAVFIYSSFEDFLVSCAKKRPRADQQIMWMAQHLVRGTTVAARLGVDWRAPMPFVEACALTWLCQMEIIAELLRAPLRARVQTIEFRRFLAHAAPVACAAGAFLQIGAPASTLSENASRAVLADAKAGVPFNASAQQRADSNARSQQAELITRALAWVETDLAPHWPVPDWNPLEVGADRSVGADLSLPVRSSS